jgi:hypothetical protein
MSPCACISVDDGDGDRCFIKASMPFRCSQSSPLASCRKSFRSAPTGAFSRDAERWQPAVLTLTACVPPGYPSSRTMGNEVYLG